MKNWMLVLVIGFCMIGCGASVKDETPGAKTSPVVKAPKPGKSSGIDWDKKLNFLLSLQEAEDVMLNTAGLEVTEAKAVLSVEYWLLDGDGTDSKEAMKALFDKLGWNNKPVKGFKSFWKGFFEGQPKDYYLGSAVKPRNNKSYRILILKFKLTPKYAGKISPKVGRILYKRD